MNFCYLKIIHVLQSTLSPKNKSTYSKNKQKKKYVCKNEDENEK